MVAGCRGSGNKVRPDWPYGIIGDLNWTIGMTVRWSSERNDRIQEQPREVVQNTTDITEAVKVTQAAVDKIARAAREVLEEAQERLKKGIRPIVVPTSEEWQVNAIRGVEPQRQEAAEVGVIATTVDIPTRTLICVFCPVRRLLHPDGHRDLDELYEVSNPHDGYDSDRDDATVRESLFPSARGRFIANTRANVKKNPKEGGLPDQRVYTVSNKTLPSIVKDRSLRYPHKIIDELELIKDVLDEACSRRCGVRTEGDDWPV
ncbi:hypothetical protein BKA83DRAFT_4628778 [Pisolithus microcarpus]|nr:hypothetical protein BKA83DRAFT_4628778 [Pisolithus microcarpus]